MLEDKVILLTGGTDSFGQKFTAIALSEYNPGTIRIFSRGEFLEHEMHIQFNGDPRLRFFIGDVRDRQSVYRAMNGADIVVHAAALKHVQISFEVPEYTAAADGIGTLRLLQAVRSPVSYPRVGGARVDYSRQ